jgi:hypothetical protein
LPEVKCSADLLTVSGKLYIRAIERGVNYRIGTEVFKSRSRPTTLVPGKIV